MDETPVVLQEKEVGGIEWRPVDKVTSPSLREKLLKLPLQAEPERAHASALIYNDRGEYLLHLRDYFPGQIWEPGMWSLLGGGREPQDAPLTAACCAGPVGAALLEEGGEHVALGRTVAAAGGEAPRDGLTQVCVRAAETPVRGCGQFLQQAQRVAETPVQALQEIARHRVQGRCRASRRRCEQSSHDRSHGHPSHLRWHIDHRPSLQDPVTSRACSFMIRA
ncbi:hypothetical protein ABZY02_31470 [Streptomyces sp. NPDC006649]|uniref:hypothetical protein n=1 Tax=Streptomyces sp. NPDC006649 TaxID=3156896 RepID=UPI0033B637A0